MSTLQVLDVVTMSLVCYLMHFSSMGTCHNSKTWCRTTSGRPRINKQCFPMCMTSKIRSATMLFNIKGYRQIFRIPIPVNCWSFEYLWNKFWMHADILCMVYAGTFVKDFNFIYIWMQRCFDIGKYENNIVYFYAINLKCSFLHAKYEVLIEKCYQVYHRVQSCGLLEFSHHL